MKLWIARDQNGDLFLYPIKPDRYVTEYYVFFNGDDWYKIDQDLFPEITFENSPIEVELVLPSQEPTIGDLLNQLMELNKEYKEFRMLVGLMRHAQTYGDKQSSFQESAVDHFIKTHNIDWD